MNATTAAAPLLSLLARCDRPGPRYTSYPTAPHFRTDFGVDELKAEIARHEAISTAPLSLYVHVPFCSSPCFYCGCTRLITRDISRGGRYVARLLHEARMAAALLPPRRPVEQFHIGGGTPNFLPATALATLVQGLKEHFQFSLRPDRDYSIELDPRALDGTAEDFAEALVGLGFNRVSIGVQDFDPQVQAAINRAQSEEETLNLVDACRDAGIGSVNLDLIYGLPRQSLAGFQHTLRTVIGARPDRIAIYGYAHVPALFKAQRQIDAASLPDSRTRLALLALAIKELESFGYRHIGMDHFALPDDELVRAQERHGLQRNFMGYTTHAGTDLLGLGVSAISRIGHSYSQNHRVLTAWERLVDAGQLPLWRGLRLSRDDRIRARIIEQLMCHGRIDIRDVESEYAIRFEEYFADSTAALQGYAREGLLQLRRESIEVTDSGRLLLRNIAMCFDRYVNEDPGTADPVMSRTV